MNIGNRLKRELKRNGMSIKQLAEESNISLDTLYSITANRTKNLQEKTIDAICNTLNITKRELLGDTLPENEVEIFSINGEDYVKVKDDQNYFSGKFFKKEDYDALKRVTDSLEFIMMKAIRRVPPEE